MADEVIQQNNAEVGDDMVVNLPEAPDMSEQYAAHDKLKQIWEDGMNEFTPKSKEDLEKERKQQKRDKIIAAVGDGISAIANLVGTMNYAPSMYNGSDKMTDKVQARFDKAKKDYDDRKAQYTNAAMNWGKIIDEDGTLKYNQWKDGVANAFAKAKNAREEKQAAANLVLTQARTETEGYKGQKAKTEADNAQRVADDAHDLSVARQGQAHAAAGASNASAHLSNTKAANEGKNGIHFMGKVYQKSEEYDKEVRKAVDKWNAEHKDDPIATTQRLGATTHNVVTKDLAAEVERKQAAVDELNSYKRN